MSIKVFSKCVDLTIVFFLTMVFHASYKESGEPLLKFSLLTACILAVLFVGVKLERYFYSKGKRG